MSSGGTNVIVLPITGSVDPALLQGLAQLAQSMDAAAQSMDNAKGKAESAGSGFGQFAGSVRGAFDGVRGAVATVTSIASNVDDVAQSIATLAAEQQALTASSQALGLNYDRASDAAGRFTDETNLAHASQQFFGSQVRLTQTELDALARVAGAASRTMGVDTATSVERLTTALTTGRESGLRGFGQELLATAGHSHSVAERLEVLVNVAGHTAQATDDAADSMLRLHDSMDDAKRVAASAFVDTLTHIESLSRDTHTAAGDVESLNTKMAALGATAARTLELVGRPVATLLGGVAIGIQSIAAAGSIRGALESGGIDAARAEAQHQAETLRALGEFTRGQWASFHAAMNDTDERTTDGNGETQRDASRVVRAGAVGPGASDLEESVLRARREDEIARNRRTAPHTPRAPRGHHGLTAEERADIQEGNRDIAESFAAARREADALRAVGMGAANDNGFMQRPLNARDVVGPFRGYDETADRAQRAARVDDDGVLGPATLAALNSADPVELLNRMRLAAKAFASAGLVVE